MSHHSYADADAKCPFYLGQSPRNIKCAGPMENGSVEIRFERGEDKMQWVARYCNEIKGFRKCPMCDSLWREWERTHPDGAE